MQNNMTGINFYYLDTMIVVFRKDLIIYVSIDFEKTKISQRLEMLKTIKLES